MVERQIIAFSTVQRRLSTPLNEAEDVQNIHLLLLRQLHDAITLLLEHGELPVEVTQALFQAPNRLFKILRLILASFGYLAQTFLSENSYQTSKDGIDADRHGGNLVGSCFSGLGSAGIGGFKRTTRLFLQTLGHCR